MDLILDRILAELWKDFATLNPRAAEIRAKLEGMGEIVVDDHIAFRTFGSSRMNMEAVAKRFEAHGYARKGEYAFPERRVVAMHLEPPEEQLPKIFVSELQPGGWTQEFHRIVYRLIQQVPNEYAESDAFLWSGAPWRLPTWGEYEALAVESEYASWVAVFGTRANHYALLLNALRFTDDLRTFNAFIEGLGYNLNRDGGKVKGSPEAGLEQSSIMAKATMMDFADGKASVPGCFYEFAKRYPGPDGELFQGFVERSADRIFSSTDR